MSSLQDVLQRLAGLSFYTELLNIGRAPKVYDEDVLAFTWFRGLTASSECLYRVRRETGEPLWCIYGPDCDFGYQPLSPCERLNDQVFLGIGEHLYGLAWETGEALWYYEHKTELAIPFLYKSSLMFCDALGRICELDPIQGKALERARFGEKLCFPKADGDILWLVELSGGLRALSAETLREKWSVPSAKPVFGRFVSLGEQLLIGPRENNNPVSPVEPLPLRSLARESGEQIWQTKETFLAFVIPSDGAPFAWGVTWQRELGVIELCSGKFFGMRRLEEKTIPRLSLDGPLLYLFLVDGLSKWMLEVVEPVGGTTLQKIPLSVPSRGIFSNLYTIQQGRLFFGSPGGEDVRPSCGCLSLLDGELLWQRWKGPVQFQFSGKAFPENLVRL